MSKSLWPGWLLLAALLAGPVLMLPLHVPLNYNEGWNAYFATRAVSPDAGPLYPPRGARVFNNYPPLSFYIVGGLGRMIGGDMILAGRIVALASLLASGGLLRLAVGGTAGQASGLLLVLYAATFFRDYVAMDDPQWLGHALMLGAVAVALRGSGTGPVPWGRVTAAAGLVLAGGFVKHMLLALPIALALHLWLRDRRAGITFAALLVGGAAGGLGLTALWHGGAAIHDILHHARQWQPGGPAKGVARLLPLLPMGLGAGIVLWPARRQPAMAFALAFMVLAALIGVAARAGAGVAVNAQFEALVAVCLACGLGLAAGRLPPAWAWMVVAVPILIVLPKRLVHAWADISQAQARSVAWRGVIERIGAARGPVACETLALCYWAGKPFVLDFFNLSQSLRVSPRAFVPPALELVEYDPASAIHIPVPDPLLAAILPGLQEQARGPGHVLLMGKPRSG